METAKVSQMVASCGSGRRFKDALRPRVATRRDALACRAGCSSPPTSSIEGQSTLRTKLARTPGATCLRFICDDGASSV